MDPATAAALASAATTLLGMGGGEDADVTAVSTLTAEQTGIMNAFYEWLTGAYGIGEQRPPYTGWREGWGAEAPYTPTSADLGRHIASYGGAAVNNMLWAAFNNDPTGVYGERWESFFDMIDKDYPYAGGAEGILNGIYAGIYSAEPLFDWATENVDEDFWFSALGGVEGTYDPEELLNQAFQEQQMTAARSLFPDISLSQSPSSLF